MITSKTVDYSGALSLILDSSHSQVGKSGRSQDLHLGVGQRRANCGRVQVTGWGMWSRTHCVGLEERCKAPSRI